MKFNGNEISCAYETFNSDKTVLKSVKPKLPEEYSVPAGVLEIGKKAFYKRQNYKKIRLPYGLRAIRNKAFEGCKNLETIVIPETVTEIEPRAFFGCKSLKRVILPPDT